MKNPVIVTAGATAVLLTIGLAVAAQAQRGATPPRTPAAQAASALQRPAHRRTASPI